MWKINQIFYSADSVAERKPNLNDHCFSVCSVLSNDDHYKFKYSHMQPQYGKYFRFDVKPQLQNVSECKLTTIE